MIRDPNYILGYWCARAAFVMKARVDEYLAPWELSTPAFGILMHVSALGTTNLAELSRETQYAHPSVLRQLDELERRGLIQRFPDPGDRRVKLVEVTPRGGALLPDMARAVEAAHAEIVKGLTSADVEQTLRTLRMIATEAARRDGTVNEGARP